MFLLEEVEVGQVHVSTSYKDTNHEMEDAFSVERKENFAPPKIHNPSDQSKNSKQ